MLVVLLKKSKGATRRCCLFGFVMLSELTPAVPELKVGIFTGSAKGHIVIDSLCESCNRTLIPLFGSAHADVVVECFNVFKKKNPQQD